MTSGKSKIARLKEKSTPHAWMGTGRARGKSLRWFLPGFSSA